MYHIIYMVEQYKTCFQKEVMFTFFSTLTKSLLFCRISQKHFKQLDESFLLLFLAPHTLSYASLAMKFNSTGYSRAVPSRIEAEDSCHYQTFIIHTSTRQQLQFGKSQKKNCIGSKKDIKSTCFTKYSPCYFWQALSHLYFVNPLFCKLLHFPQLSVPVLYYSHDCKFSFLYNIMLFILNSILLVQATSPH